MCAKRYDDDSIVSLKGADRVRKRPAVIFAAGVVSADTPRTRTTPNRPLRTLHLFRRKRQKEV